MMSAENWFLRLFRHDTKGEPIISVTVQDIRSIQVDALKRAVAIVLTIASRHPEPNVGHVAAEAIEDEVSALLKG